MVIIQFVCDNFISHIRKRTRVAESSAKMPKKELYLHNHQYIIPMGNIILIPRIRNSTSRITTNINLCLTKEFQMMSKQKMVNSKYLLNELILKLPRNNGSNAYNLYQKGIPFVVVFILYCFNYLYYYD